MPEMQSSSGASPEFKKFRELTERIVLVPKSEVQERMNAHPKKQRKRKKQK